MSQYRQVLVRMRMGESNRAIAESGLMGRKKAQVLRKTAEQHGWLDKHTTLPDNAALATILNTSVHASSHLSTVLPYADKVKQWLEDGIQGRLSIPL